MPAPLLVRQIAQIRFLGYGGVALVLLVTGTSSYSALALAWCVLTPLCITRLASSFRRRGILRVHLVEAALTSAVFAAAGVHSVLLLTTFAMLSIGATAQAGFVFATRVCLVSVLGVLFGVRAGAGPPPCAPEWLAGYCLVLVAACALLLAHVAWQQGKWGRRQRREVLERALLLERYLPEPVSQQFDQEPGGKVRRRWMTVAFVDLVGFTELTEAMAAEEMDPLLDGFVEVTAATTREHGGYIAKVIGDGALLAFEEAGREQAAGGAFGCCLALASALAAVSTMLDNMGTPCVVEVRAGIASGFCSVGEWGAGERLEFSVMGRPVNLASRLQELAQPGAVLVCERTASLLSDVVSLSGVETAWLKGIGEVSYRRVS